MKVYRQLLGKSIMSLLGSEQRLSFLYSSVSSFLAWQASSSLPSPWCQTLSSSQKPERSGKSVDDKRIERLLNLATPSRQSAMQIKHKMTNLAHIKMAKGKSTAQMYTRGYEWISNQERY